MLLIALAAAMLRLAWLSDDAFITLRTVENCAAGRGLCWNVGERVQTFTHPLWCLLLVPLRLCCGELLTATMLWSVALSLAAVVVMVRVLGAAAGLVLIGLLLGSRAWLDFTSSGLETPLVYLLLALTIAAWSRTGGERRLGLVALLTGAAVTTRLDLVTLFGPICLFAMVGVPRRRALLLVARGAVLPLAWAAFAIVYYGSPFPVTAFAKAFGHGLGRGELLASGLRFLMVNAMNDPVTAGVIVLGLLLGLCRREHRPVALGVLCYLIYCVQVGGDYMLGRFLAPPFLLAAFVVVQVARTAGARWSIGLLLAVAIVAGVAVRPGWAEPVQRDVEALFQGRDDGFADERRFYYAVTGLWSPQRLPLQPGVVSAGRRAAGDSERKVVVAGMVGMLGYVEGELTHLVDPWLTDPLLMRLPVGDHDDWRIGHYYRRIPTGHLRHVATGDASRTDERLRPLQAAVAQVVSGPIWSAARWRSIWQLWTGAFDDALRDYLAHAYYSPPRQVVQWHELDLGAAPQGQQWWQVEQARTCAGGGVSVELPQPRRVERMVLWLIGGGSRYHIELRRGDATVFAAERRVDGSQLGGFQRVEVEVPAGIGEIERVWLTTRATVAFPEAPFVGGLQLQP